MAYASFFGASLALLVLLLRPETLPPTYIFSVTVVAIAFVMFSFEAGRTLRNASL